MIIEEGMGSVSQWIDADVALRASKDDAEGNIPLSQLTRMAPRHVDIDDESPSTEESDCKSVVLPINASKRDIAQAFGKLFRDKIANIRNGLESDLISGCESVVSDKDEVSDVVLIVSNPLQKNR